MSALQRNHVKAQQVCDRLLGLILCSPVGVVVSEERVSYTC